MRKNVVCNERDASFFAPVTVTKIFYCSAFLVEFNLVLRSLFTLRGDYSPRSTQPFISYILEREGEQASWALGENRVFKP